MQGFDAVLSDMLHFTTGVNDAELSLELAGAALHVSTGHFFDLYGPSYAQQLGLAEHSGFLRPGGSLVMKVYDVRHAAAAAAGSRAVLFGAGGCMAS